MGGVGTQGRGKKKKLNRRGTQEKYVVYAAWKTQGGIPQTRQSAS